MEPLEIKVELLRAQITQTDIARACRVSVPTVAKVIVGKTVSDRIQRKIAKAINRPVEEVFPQCYQQQKSRAEIAMEKLAS